MKSEILLSENTCKYSYFEKGCRKNLHATIPKVIRDMINTVLLTKQLSNPLLLLSYSLAPANIRSWALVLLFYFSLNWKTVYSKPPTIPLEIDACTFSSNLSRNSCVHNVTSSTVTTRSGPLLFITSRECISPFFFIFFLFQA